MMSRIEKQVGQARNRLTLNIVLEALSVGLLVGGSAWALTTLVTRLLALDLPLWHGAWMAASIGVLFALGGVLRYRPSLFAAAVALDGAAGLKERLSTALSTLHNDDPFVRAARRDAEKTATTVHVPTHVHYRSPRLWPWSATSLVVALLLVWLMPVVDLFAGEQDGQEQVEREQVEAEKQAIASTFEQSINRIKELSQGKPGLKDLAAELEPLELPTDPTATPEDIRRDAVKRIDDVRDKLKKQLDESNYDPSQELKRMLARLKQQGANAQSDTLSQTLADGDFSAAKKELEKMIEELKEAARNSDDPEVQQRVAQMEQDLRQLAEKMAKLGDSVRVQKELENKAGLSEEQAKELLDKLKNMDREQLQKELQKQLADKGLSEHQIKELAKKIQQNQQACKSCKNLAQALSQAAQSCSQCQGSSGSSAAASQGAAAMADAMNQLSQLEMSEQLMNELTSQLAEMGDFRNDVCQGQCQGNGQGQRGGIGRQGPQYGRGLGDNVGKERTPYQADPTKAKSRFQGGEIIGQMLVDGPQVPGHANAEALSAAEAELRDALDAIDRNEVPRQYEKVMREYFARLAGLIEQQQDASNTSGEESSDAPAPDTSTADAAD